MTAVFCSGFTFGCLKKNERIGITMRLLIVEDEEDMREALCYGLRKRGYAVDAAGDGADAVEQCGINEYDLVVLDLNLPGLDGMEVLKHIRSMEKPAKVLILSARSELTDKIRGGRPDEGRSLPGFQFKDGIFSGKAAGILHEGVFDSGIFNDPYGQTGQRRGTAGARVGQ